MVNIQKNNFVKRNRSEKQFYILNLSDDIYYEICILTDRVIILSKSITGAMWKSKTKYCKRKF